MRIIQSPLANLDIAGIAEYLGQDSPDTGLRFLSAIKEAIQKLAEMPGLGGELEIARPNIPFLRVWPIGGFENYLVIYHSIRDGIKVVRVLHGSRDIAAIFQKE